MAIYLYEPDSDIPLSYDTLTEAFLDAYYSIPKDSGKTEDPPHYIRQIAIPRDNIIIQLERIE